MAEERKKGEVSLEISNGRTICYLLSSISDHRNAGPSLDSLSCRYFLALAPLGTNSADAKVDTSQGMLNRDAWLFASSSLCAKAHRPAKDIALIPTYEKIPVGRSDEISQNRTIRFLLHSFANVGPRRYALHGQPAGSGLAVALLEPLPVLAN
jgi:hypothetical protein